MQIICKSMVQNLYISKQLNEDIIETPSSIHLAKKYLAIVISMLGSLKMMSLMDMVFSYHPKK